MKIGVDAGCLGIKDTRLKVGVYQMAKSLFEELAKLDTQNIYLLYSFYPIDKALLKGFGKNIKNIVVKPSRGWTKIWLPLQLLRDKPDVFVGLNQSLPLKLPLQEYTSIVVIHDVLFENYPKLYPGSYRKLHRESKSAALISDVIITPSVATKKDIEKFYGVSEKKITVIPEGVRAFPKENGSRIRSGMTASPYFLFVGALKPQKNVPMLLNAFSSMVAGRKSPAASKGSRSRLNNNPHPNLLPDKQGEGGQGIKLIVVGGDKWKDKEIDKTFKALPEEVRKRIHFLGSVSDEELAGLYMHTIALVSPSVSEGFGLPFLEAMSFGTPVIGPNTGAVPEVVGKSGILIDPTSKNELRKAMGKMLDSKTQSLYKKHALMQAQKFSWREFAKSFLEEVEKLRAWN